MSFPNEQANKCFNSHKEGERISCFIYILLCIATSERCLKFAIALQSHKKKQLKKPQDSSQAFLRFMIFSAIYYLTSLNTTAVQNNCLRRSVYQERTGYI